MPAGRPVSTVFPVDEVRPTILALAAAWAVTTVAAILATARAGGSLGDAILAPLWVAGGVAILLVADRVGPALLGATVLLVVAGLARGYGLGVDLDLVPAVGPVSAVATWAVYAAVALGMYDVWRAQQSTPRGG